MYLKLPTDEDTNRLFDDVVSLLVKDIGYSETEAIALVREYYSKFTDEEYCESIGIPVQDDDYFFHESAGGMALRIHYYLKLKADPDPIKFLEWRWSRRGG